MQSQGKEQRINVRAKKCSCHENKQFLLCSNTSKEEFVKEYKLYGKTQAKELYLQILTELEGSIVDGNIDSFKNLSKGLSNICSVEKQGTLKSYYYEEVNPIKSTNLIILACKFNKVEILEYVLVNNSILNNLSNKVGKKSIKPDDKDEQMHNAFYYAIRSDTVKLLHVLIDKWPDNYLVSPLNELENILSQAYEELKLKNVLLSADMENYIESKLIDLRFFSNKSGPNQSSEDDLNNIRERIKLVLENISFLNSCLEVGERFLFVAKFLAKNINILKQQLKSTYVRLPWEEIEFCLVCFVSSKTKQQKINLFYQATLNREKILKHLNNFAKKLEDEKVIIMDVDVENIAVLPKLKRENVIQQIIDGCPQFKELYDDYQQIRDIYSLWNIGNYIILASSADPKEKEGQLIIIRTLQVMGEHFKNSLESPKLSNTTSELFLLSLSSSTRKIIIDLRDSFSHAQSLSKRSEIEENKEANFFYGVQKDIVTIGKVITNILYNSKIKIMKMLLEMIVNCESIGEINEVAEKLNNIQIELFLRFDYTREEERIKKLLDELIGSITKMTDWEEEHVQYITSLLKLEETKSNNLRADHLKLFSSLVCFIQQMNYNKIDENRLLTLKWSKNIALESVDRKVETHPHLQSSEVILQSFIHFFLSVRSKIKSDKLEKIENLFSELLCVNEFGKANTKWIDSLKEKLNFKSSLEYKARKNYRESNVNKSKQLISKLSELNIILSKNTTCKKDNKKFHVVVEILVQDIMSILDYSKRLVNNQLFLNDHSPLLVGKCLRNHIANDNAIVNVLSSNPSRAIILNAKKLTSENIIENKKKIGNPAEDEPSKLKEKYDESLDIITNQEGMFVALEEGNLEDLKRSLEKGADLNARNSINLGTAFHFAAKGPSLEVLKFVQHQNVHNVTTKDSNGQSPLHIAASYGRKSIVEFFLDAGLYVDDLNNIGRTPLHIAAQNGQNDVVRVLLKNKANTHLKDKSTYSPLHWAVLNNFKLVTETLLEEETNVDINRNIGGHTSLHIAAEYGHLEIVNLLLQRGADVNARNFNRRTPLLTAALYGHLDVVNALIFNGADVNTRAIDDLSPLHCAVEGGHEKIVDILLQNGANVNAADNIYRCTPLHQAAKHGHGRIVKILLQSNANVNDTTVENFTPLYFAIQNGHEVIVVELLNHGVDVNDAKNAEALHFAALHGRKEIADILIKHKANVNAKNKLGYSPLHLAAQEGHFDIINLLIKHGAEVNATVNNCYFSLYGAVNEFYDDEIATLICNNAEAIDPTTSCSLTALHIAALNGHKEAVHILIKNNTDVNDGANLGFTPLHAAALKGHKDVLHLLIQNKAEVNATDIAGGTPLHTAVVAGHKDVVELLIDNGANVNAMSEINPKPLLFAVTFRWIEIIEILIAKGANGNANEDKYTTILATAVYSGYYDIVKIFLKYHAQTNVKLPKNYTLIHIAAGKGDKRIVNELIRYGADVNSKTNDNVTPLYFAAERGEEIIAKVLIKNGADVNAKTIKGVTPLQIAAKEGHCDVVKLLLNSEAEINAKDSQNRMAVEFATRLGHLEVMKTLLQCVEVDVNAKGNNEFTLLHSAAMAGSLEITKLLINKGANILAKNDLGSKPIHIAAREGSINVLKLYIDNGLSINELGMTGKTLLHYAATGGQSEVSEYLIRQGADVNAKDANGLTPLHCAAIERFKDVAKVLLSNGAAYDAVDNSRQTPSKMAKSNNDAIKLLESTESLFEAVRCNSPIDVENYISKGAFVNAKNSQGETSLHIAAKTGYDVIVIILLKNTANPNEINNVGFTPMHYAAKFSYLKIVKTLLAKGAVYNLVSKNGKTPFKLTVDRNIICILKLVSESFKKVKNGNCNVIDDLNEVNDLDTLKAVMNACNREKETLVVSAMLNNFPKVEHLKLVSTADVFQILQAMSLVDKENYHEALSIFKVIFENRKEILGPDNPGTLDIQMNIAEVKYKLGSYQEALSIFEEIFQKNMEMFGLHSKNTLRARNNVALILHKLGRNSEALEIYQEICPIQKEILMQNDLLILETKHNMAIVLENLGNYEEALNINHEVFKMCLEIYGPKNVLTIPTQNRIAMVLARQRKFEEALKLCKFVYEKKKVVLGIHHSDTLRTLHNMARILEKQGNYPEAMQSYQDILQIQKTYLGRDHVDTVITQSNIANLLFRQSNFIEAYQAFKEAIHQLKKVFGSNHHLVIFNQMKMDMAQKLRRPHSDILDIFQNSKEDLNIAASNGDEKNVQRLLRNGADVNDKDIDGRTPLHFAVDNGHIGIVIDLLKNGADVTLVTNKGDTALHIAVLKGYDKVAEVLLQHVNQDKLNDFVDARTTAGGTTSLHVASKNGLLEIVKSLLRYGATFDIKNKEGKTPLDLSKDTNIINLLKQVEELFVLSKTDDVQFIRKLIIVKPIEFQSIEKVRNNTGKTLIQVVVVNQLRYRDLVIKIVEWLQNN